jgi:hypothetical protein
MVGDRYLYLNAQRPKPVQERTDGRPGPWQLGVTEKLTAPDPPIQCLHRRSQERKGRLGGIQGPKPAAEGTCIGYAIRIFDSRCRRFPGTAFDKIAPQRFTPGKQAVMGVRKRKNRQESNRLAARSTDPAPNLNPVMVFIMGLFATTPMTNDRISRADRAAAKDPFGHRPIRFQLALRFRK